MPFLRPKPEKWHPIQAIKPLMQIILLILKQIHQGFLKNISLVGRFLTPVLDNTIELPYIKGPHQEHSNKRVKKDTLFKDREPQKPYPIPRHVPI